MYVSVPFSVTGTGLTDLVIVRTGVLSTVISSSAVIGVMPVPATIAVLFITEVVSSGANSLTAASYATVTLPPAGTVIPDTTSGGPAVTTADGCNTPFT